MVGWHYYQRKRSGDAHHGAPVPRDPDPRTTTADACALGIRSPIGIGDGPSWNQDATHRGRAARTRRRQWCDASMAFRISAARQSARPFSHRTRTGSPSADSAVTTSHSAPNRTISGHSLARTSLARAVTHHSGTASTTYTAPRRRTAAGSSAPPRPGRTGTTQAPSRQQSLAFCSPFPLPPAPRRPPIRVGVLAARHPLDAHLHTSQSQALHPLAAEPNVLKQHRRTRAPPANELLNHQP